MKYVLSDTHLFHQLVLNHRPEFSSVQQMNDYIVDHWKSIIKPEDTVYHLGDFAFGEDFDAIEKIVQALPGKVTLILGNHDTPKKIQLYSKYWKIASAVFDDGFILSHVPVHPSLLREETVRKEGGKIRFNIHGHCHRPNPNLPTDMYYNVCWDVNPRCHIYDMRMLKASMRVLSLHFEEFKCE